MSQKRKHVENAEDISSAPKPFKKHRAFKPGQNNQQPKQHRRLNLSHDDENGRSTNALKSRIRDLKRFMTHMDSVEKHKMSAGARQERERELEACEHELAEKLNSSREAEYRKKMIGKYHQVRFFGMSPDVSYESAGLIKQIDKKARAYSSG
jgi:type VI protein secretion system component VasF